MKTKQTAEKVGIAHMKELRANAQRLADACKQLTQFTFTDYHPQVALQILVKIKREMRLALAQWKQAQ